MSTRQERILVVDDVQLLRHTISSILANVPHLHVVAEASDGIDAVHTAQELQPDLILLDIGLPQLNGIEAARQIGKVAPRSRIVFVSQNSSPDIVQAALDTGAWGYVLKANVGSELLTAVSAVLRGERFISGQAPQFGGASPDIRPELR